MNKITDQKPTWTSAEVEEDMRRGYFQLGLTIGLIVGFGLGLIVYSIASR